MKKFSLAAIIVSMLLGGCANQLTVVDENQQYFYVDSERVYVAPAQFSTLDFEEGVTVEPSSRCRPVLGAFNAVFEATLLKNRVTVMRNKEEATTVVEPRIFCSEDIEDFARQVGKLKAFFYVSHAVHEIVKTNSRVYKKGNNEKKEVLILETEKTSYFFLRDPQKNASNQAVIAAEKFLGKFRSGKTPLQK